jgi:hypothetical protein
MSLDPSLSKLILENLDDLDAAAQQIYPIERRIYEEISERLEAWAASLGWAGNFDPENTLRVFRPEWLEGEMPWATLDIGWGPGDAGNQGEGEPYFDLSRLAGANGGRLCLWLVFSGIRRSVWEKVFKAAAEQADTGGFLLDDRDGFYLDCTPPTGSMADAFDRNDFTRAFGPLDAALQRAATNWQKLDELLRAARG